MASVIPFVRQLGAQSGVQLNPLVDNSERPSFGTASQVFAGLGRFKRGRIDKPTVVTRQTLRRLLGAPESPLANPLNEAMVQIYEALSNGAYMGVIQRLTPAAAKNQWVGIKAAAAVDDCFSMSDNAPTADFVLAVRHLECFNSGAKFAVNAVKAEAESIVATSTSDVPLTGTTPLTIGGVTINNDDRVKLTGQAAPAENGIYKMVVTGSNYTLTSDADTVPVPSKWVTLRILDVDDTELFSFAGSLDPTAKDEFGESTYLPSVVSMLTDLVDVVVAENAEVATDSIWYGDTTGVAKEAVKLMTYFSEGGTTYATTDLDAALAKLLTTQTPFQYLGGLGTESTALIAKLAAFGKEYNKQLCLDVPGKLDVSAAITFVSQLNIDSHYVQWYWAPMKAVDPLNGGKAFIGTSGLQIGLRCARNARADANGIPPMHYPIAGKSYMVSRTKIEQLVTPTDPDLDKLAQAKINPVIFQTYNSGSGYVFFDSLTAAKTSGDRKLIAVAEMSSQNDDWVTAQVKEYLQLPISDTVRLTADFLKKLFEAEETAGWLVPSQELEGKSFIAEVKPNAARPKDAVDVRYWMSYEGTTRAVFVEQTIVK